MRTKFIFVMAMVMIILPLSFASVSQAGSLMDTIEFGVNSFRQCYGPIASDEQDQQGEQNIQEEEEEEEPDCD